MKRTTISLPDDLARAVEREARRRDTSASAVVRVALVAHLGVGAKRKPLPFANLGASGRGDTSSRIEEILAEEWTLDQHR
jgi:Arc/MetJ-type ribon-helix-helix transcriptional regulator